MLKEARKVLKPDGAFLFRDLKRPSNRIALELYVQIFWGSSTTLYRKSFTGTPSGPAFHWPNFKKWHRMPVLKGLK